MVAGAPGWSWQDIPDDTNHDAIGILATQQHLAAADLGDQRVAHRSAAEELNPDALSEAEIEEPAADRHVFLLAVSGDEGTLPTFEAAHRQTARGLRVTDLETAVTQRQRDRIHTVRLALPNSPDQRR